MGIQSFGASMLGDVSQSMERLSGEFNTSAQMVRTHYDDKQRLENAQKDAISTMYQDDVSKILPAILKSTDFDNYADKLSQFNNDFIAKLRSGGMYTDSVVTWAEQDLLSSSTALSPDDMGPLATIGRNGMTASLAFSKANMLAVDPSLSLDDAKNQWQSYYDETGLSGLPMSYGVPDASMFENMIRQGKAVQAFQSDAEQNYGTIGWKVSDAIERYSNDLRLTPEERTEYINEAYQVLGVVQSRLKAQSDELVATAQGQYLAAYSEGKRYDTEELLLGIRELPYAYQGSGYLLLDTIQKTNDQLLYDSMYRWTTGPLGLPVIPNDDSLEAFTDPAKADALMGAILFDNGCAEYNANGGNLEKAIDSINNSSLWKRDMKQAKQNAISALVSKYVGENADAKNASLISEQNNLTRIADSLAKGEPLTDEILSTVRNQDSADALMTPYLLDAGLDVYEQTGDAHEALAAISSFTGDFTPSLSAVNSTQTKLLAAIEGRQNRETKSDNINLFNLENGIPGSESDPNASDDGTEALPQDNGSVPTEAPSSDASGEPVSNAKPTSAKGTSEDPGIIYRIGDSELTFHTRDVSDKAFQFQNRSSDEALAILDAARIDPYYVNNQEALADLVAKFYSAGLVTEEDANDRKESPEFMKKTQEWTEMTDYIKTLANTYYKKDPVGKERFTNQMLRWMKNEVGEDGSFLSDFRRRDDFFSKLGDASSDFVSGTLLKSLNKFSKIIDSPEDLLNEIDSKQYQELSSLYSQDFMSLLIDDTAQSNVGYNADGSVNIGTYNSSDEYLKDFFAIQLGFGTSFSEMKEYDTTGFFEIRVMANVGKVKFENSVSRLFRKAYEGTGGNASKGKCQIKWFNGKIALSDPECSGLWWTVGDDATDIDKSLLNWKFFKAQPDAKGDYHAENILVATPFASLVKQYGKDEVNDLAAQHGDKLPEYSFKNDITLLKPQNTVSETRPSPIAGDNVSVHAPILRVDYVQANYAKIFASRRYW